MVERGQSVITKIENIEKKITSLKPRVLSPRNENDDKISETLKGSIRGCFEQIAIILSEIEKIEDKELQIFKRKDILSKRKSLETHLRAAGVLDQLQAELEIPEGFEFLNVDSGSNSQKKLLGQKRNRQSGSKLSSLFDNEYYDDPNPIPKKKSIENREKKTNKVC